MKLLGTVLLLAAAALLVACGGDGGDNGNSANTTPAVGGWQELAFFPGGRLTDAPVPLRVNVESAVIGTSALAGGAPRDAIIVHVSLDNQTDSAAARPNFVIVTPDGQQLPFYTGDFEGPQNISELKEIAAGEQLDGALYLDLFSLQMAPPDSLAGWQVKAVSSGVAPTDGIEASWRFE